MKMMRNFKTKWLAGLLLAVLCLTGLWLPGSAAAEEPDGSTGTYFDGWYQTTDSDAVGQQSWQQRSRSIGYFDGSFGDQLEGNARAFYQALASADMTQHTSSDSKLKVSVETEYTFSFANNGGNFSDELSSNGAESYKLV